MTTCENCLSLEPDWLDNLLIQEEGYREFIYYDQFGNPTIGIGTNLKNGISKKQALALLMVAKQDVENNLTQLPWYVGLDSVRKRVIIDMAYNMGVAGVLGFHGMIEAIIAKNWIQAAANMLNSLWAKQVGNRAVVLSEVMKTGIPPVSA